MTLADRWTNQLESLRAAGRYRSLALPCGVDFSSNDYLGYGGGRLPLCEAALPDSNAVTGRSGMASRLLRGHQAIWDEVESLLASWHGAAAAVMMTSGYVANEGLLATVIEPGDWVASDQYNHASIIDGLRLARAERFVYRHLDLNHLEHGLHAAARKRPAGRQLFIVTESLFGMDGDLTPLDTLVALAERYEAHLIVDEAHATGCFGVIGSGCVDAAGLRQRILASVHTGGKALGVPGAYIVGSATLKELLVNRCRHLIFTTAMAPALGTWWKLAVDRVQNDEAGRFGLHRGAAFFRERLTGAGVRPLGASYIVPIILEDDLRATKVAACLQQAGWDIRAIRPPSVPVGTARLRIGIHADHGLETLSAAADAVAQAFHSN